MKQQSENIQEKEDVLEDKLTKRESHNPFKGLLQ